MTDNLQRDSANITPRICTPSNNGSGRQDGASSNSVVHNPSPDAAPPAASTGIYGSYKISR